MERQILSKTAICAICTCLSLAAVTARANAQSVMPELSAPFTLKYSISYKDTTSPAYRKALIEYNVKFYRSLVQQGKISDSGARQMTNDIERSARLQNANAEVTISADGKRLLYQYCEPSSATADTITEVYNGTYSLVLQRPNRGGRQSLVKFSGFQTRYLRDLPFAGCNLPGLTLAKMSVNSLSDSDLSKRAVSTAADVFYGPNTDAVALAPGDIRYKIVDNMLQLTNANSGYNGKVSAQWQFTDYQPLKGIWIASKFHLDEGMLDGSPRAGIDYSLISADAASLPSCDFDLVGQLKQWDTVQLGGTSFDYQPGAGSIEQQAKGRRGDLALAQSMADRGNVGQRSILGSVVIACGFALASIWFVLHNNRRRK
jgi:hypothetical protein